MKKKRRRKKSRRKLSKQQFTAIALCLLTAVTICAYSLFKYADRQCRAYLGKPLSYELIKQQVGPMTGDSKLPEGNWSYGIDISHHQPIVNWINLKVYVDRKGRTVWSLRNAVRIESVDYVIMKATEGGDFKDNRFKDRWVKAETFGYKRGAYHFFRPGKSAKVQAENYINTVERIKRHDFAPILDIEKTDGQSKTVINQRVLEWLKIVEKHYGRKPIIYANPYYLNTILSSEITENYPIWVANYATSKPSYPRWHMWQFTDKGIVRGVGRVDLNVCPKDSALL